MNHHLPELECSVPEHRRSADKQLLAELVSSQSGAPKAPLRWVPHTVRGVIVAGLVVCTIVGGGAAAAVLLRPQNPTVRNEARCYTKVSTDFSASFPGSTITILRPNGGGYADVPDAVIAACASGWRQGGLGQPRPGPNSPPPTGQFPVPALVACVLPDGEAAVFPGGPKTCEQLGLPRMSPQTAPTSSRQ